MITRRDFLIKTGQIIALGGTALIPSSNIQTKNAKALTREEIAAIEKKQKAEAEQLKRDGFIYEMDYEIKEYLDLRTRLDNLDTVIKAKMTPLFPPNNQKEYYKRIKVLNKTLSKVEDLSFDKALSKCLEGIHTAELENYDIKASKPSNAQLYSAINSLQVAANIYIDAVEAYAFYTDADLVNRGKKLIGLDKAINKGDIEQMMNQRLKNVEQKLKSVENLFETATFQVTKKAKKE